MVVLANNSNASDDFESAAVKAVDELVGRAERAGASDVHLQMCGSGESGAQVSFRLDGLMAPVDEFSAAVAGRVFGRIKYLARLKTYQDSLPQDGRIAREEINAAHDVRVATYPTDAGLKEVAKLKQLTELYT